MALVICGECGKEISTEAKACPHCGAKPPYRPSFALVMIAILLFAFGFNVLFDRGGSPSIPKTAEQIALDEAEKRRNLTVAIIAKELKNTLREPQSVEWISMSTDDNAEVVCLRYRARNGFGGMAVEVMTVTPQKVGQDAALWNRHCTRDGLHNMIHVRHAL